MKAKIFKSVMTLTIMLATSAIFSSCSKDNDDRDPFVGIYRCEYEITYYGQITKGTYTLTIAKSSTNKNDIILNNIDDWGESVRATVSGNAMTIPMQTIQDVGITGSGTLNGNTLNFSTQESETGGTQVNSIQTAIKQ